MSEPGIWDLKGKHDVNLGGNWVGRADVGNREDNQALKTVLKTDP